MMTTMVRSVMIVRKSCREYGGGGFGLLSRQQMRAASSVSRLSTPVSTTSICLQKRDVATTTSVKQHPYVSTAAPNGGDRGVFARATKKAPKIHAPAPPPPTPQQIRNYFMTTSIPMLGFGFMDQTVMIQAGNLIDCSIGVWFGLSTLAAAALGQVVSGAVAALFGGTMDQLFAKMGLPRSGLTAAQRALPVVARTKVSANFIGVVLGCLLGLINLAFIDTDQASIMKLEALADDVEFAYEIKASNKIRKDATVVTVKGPDISGVLASMTTALSESNYDLKEVRAVLSSSPDTTTDGDDSSTITTSSAKTIDDVIVVCKNGHQVPNDELEELAQLLLAATRSPINLLRAQARALEVENLKDRINKLENLLRERQVKVEEG